jgi:NAD(P)-dependent dehydrogenase (short-subunit alcohol dehydrogenase family)
MRLKGKVAIITGAGSGIGAATAKLFAKEGARVVVADINQKAGRAVVRQIKRDGGEATFVEVDVTRAADNKRMIQTAIESYGRLDILFNNAGVLGDNLDETTEEKWRRVIDVNLTGPYLACMYAIPIMRKQGGGNIIATASIAGFQAGGRSPAYASSKCGLIILTRTLAKHLGKDNIRVNCVCPGHVDTGFTEPHLSTLTEEARKARIAASIAATPMGRLVKPEEIASAVLFLATDEPSIISGSALVVDGGLLA